MKRITFSLALSATLCPAAAVRAQTTTGSTPNDYRLERVRVGGEAGMAVAAGRLSDELNIGFAGRAYVNLQGGAIDWLSLELDLGFARQGRSVDSAIQSLWRVPLNMSMLGTLHARHFQTPEDIDRTPEPYLRAGIGEGLALLGRGSKTRFGEGDLDLVLHYGGGLWLPISGWFDNERMVGRLDVRHVIQFEDVVGHFVEITLGVAYDFPMDSDGDGILDTDDGCPEEAEDVDGFKDSDGCPEPDNDRDGLLDEDDGCPNEAEDLDDYQDEDGCPDSDNDADGIPDELDDCPLQAEDVDGFEDADGCPDTDNDADGLFDAQDQCPDEAEDRDQYQDGDGCPDLDNDKDGFPDESDACPNQPEDKNGHKDDDGCPDAEDDQDGDGITDADDQCPTEAEDLDQFEDENGCPDPDNDGDGVLDATDLCPMEPEDIDQYADEDGCPELDNDGDGIGDQADKCPNQSEVINGFEDDDGCPDEGAALVKLTAERIEISEKVYFEVASATIQERSHGLLGQIASLLKNHAEVRKVRIEGHTDSQGGESYNQKLSDDRAKSVRSHLIGLGIAEARLEAVGYGESKPIASNDSRRGREMNRRVEFHVVDEPPPAPEVESEPEPAGAADLPPPEPPPLAPEEEGAEGDDAKAEDPKPEEPKPEAPKAEEPKAEKPAPAEP